MLDQIFFGERLSQTKNTPKPRKMVMDMMPKSNETEESEDEGMYFEGMMRNKAQERW